MKKTLIVLFLILSASMAAQKKPLDHSVYDGWKSLSSSILTDDGRYVSYEINPQQGDGNLFLYDTREGTEEVFERGNRASFSPGNDYYVFSIKPEYDLTRQAKKDKKKPDEMPKNNMAIKVLKNSGHTIIERVKSFKLPSDEGNWMAYLMEKPLPEKKDKDEAEGEEVEEKEKQEEKEAPARGRRGKKNDAKGTELVIINPVDDKEYKFGDVVEYTLSDKGNIIAFVKVTTDTTDIENYAVTVFDTDSEDHTEIFNGDGKLKSLTASKDGSSVSFLYTSDTTDVKVYDLYLWHNQECNKIVDTGTPGMPEGWSVSENGRLSFSDSGERLFFGTAEKPMEEPEDTLLADEKYKLDIWSWHDPLLQPQQKLQLERDKKRSY